VVPVAGGVRLAVDEGQRLGVAEIPGVADGQVERDGTVNVVLSTKFLVRSPQCAYGTIVGQAEASTSAPTGGSCSGPSSHRRRNGGRDSLRRWARGSMRASRRSIFSFVKRTS